MIYLDHAATTACAQEVIDAMLPYFRETFANASSIDHLPGSAARKVVDDAREAVASLVGARAEDVIFTSGSTEANNLALSAAARIVTTAIEHPSVLDVVVARGLSDDAVVGVDKDGIVLESALREKLDRGLPGTLVSIIATNNETGTEQDIDLLSELVRSSGALFHIDATQAVGTRQFNVRQGAISGLSLSAHKIYGPKGVGALIATTSLRRAMKPLLRGGGHERGFRSGTLNVPGIVGFGVAAKLATGLREKRRRHLTQLRRHFLDALKRALRGAVSETVTDRIASPHVLSLRLHGTNGRALLRALRDEVAFSLGSACATNKTEPSHVLLALGLDRHAIAETVRISFAADQTLPEVERAAHLFAESARSLSNYSVSA
jgi:cysteine desulfurase